MTSGGKKQRLGAFEIVKDLAAKGAQGKLFVGRVVEPSFPGLEIGQLVALKVMPVHADDGERQFRRLKRRTDALAATNHPGIVRYYGCFNYVGSFSEDFHVIVMELLKGQTLEERLAGNSLGLDADEVLKIIRTCAAALSCAAEHGIVHRDIKPSNIFLCEDGGAKLIDFEIARQDGASRTTTESGAMRGTVDYMAPDFHQDFRPEKDFRGDQCSDVFSLTVCLYEMLAGCRPYAAGGALGEQSMMAYFQRWTRVPGVDVNRALKIEPYKIHALAHVQKVIKRGLSPERTGRYLTYFEFSDALRAVKLREIISPTARYQLLRCVGKGGFGVVFRARRVDDGMIVAIKCLLRPEYSERFIREAKVLRKFHDDRLVSFVEYFKTVRGATETFFIVMQFLEGMPGFSLRDRINGVKAGGRLPPREIAVAFRRFAEGLQLLHEAGVIHRDVKPANLYMPPGHPEKACVMDLGVAKTDETQTNGSLPGTLDYMPPEMATGSSRGEPAVDIYALGLCLYEALTCKTAYPRLKRGGDGLAAFYKRAKAGDKPDLSGLDGSPMWRKLVTKMTDPDVGRRVKTAKDVVRLISRIPDAELPDVRERNADAANPDSADNYVLPESPEGALPAGETSESVDSDSHAIHGENIAAEHDSTQIADVGTDVEEPVPPAPPARTNVEAEEKLSAAIAEVEGIMEAHGAAEGDAPDATAAGVADQTLVLDATVAAQGTTTAAVSATAATKAFDGTAAGAGDQTLVLDATAAAQDTTTAAVSATAATKAFDGTAAGVGDRTVATVATSPSSPAGTAAGSKAEPAVIISRPRRSRTPLVIAASLAVCAIAGSLIALSRKAENEGKRILPYIAERYFPFLMSEPQAPDAPRPGPVQDFVDDESRFVNKAAEIVANLNRLRDEVLKSDSPISFTNDLRKAGVELETAWAVAREAGVAESVYTDELVNYGMASNNFLRAIAERRMVIVEATADFKDNARSALESLEDMIGEIRESMEADSHFRGRLQTTETILGDLWNKAKNNGVPYSAYANSMATYTNISEKVAQELEVRRKAWDRAKAEKKFREDVNKELDSLARLDIAGSDNPDSFLAGLKNAGNAIDKAWEGAGEAGVAEREHDDALARYGTASNQVMFAIERRRAALALEFVGHTNKYARISGTFIGDAGSYRKALADIDSAKRELPSYGASSPWKKHYDGLRRQYDEFRNRISAPTAKITVENAGGVEIEVSLGGKTAKIAKGGTHVFESIAVWTRHELSAKVPPPADVDYSKIASKKAETKGQASSVSVSFAATYKGDPVLVVRNENNVAVTIKGKTAVTIKGKTTVGPGRQYSVSGPPRTRIALEYDCDDSDYEFKNGNDKSQTLPLGNAGTTTNVVAPTLKLKPDPTIKVVLGKEKLKDGRLVDWADKHPHVEWYVKLDSEPAKEYKIGQEIGIHADTGITLRRRENGDFGGDYGKDWFKYGGLSENEYDECKYAVSVGKADKAADGQDQMPLKRGQAIRLKRGDQVRTLVFNPEEAVASEWRKKNKDWLRNHVNYGLLDEDSTVYKGLASGSERNYWPAHVMLPVEALLMLKEVYDEEVDRKYIELLRGAYSYEELWNQSRRDDWNRLKGYLKRLGVPEPPPKQPK